MAGNFQFFFNVQGGSRRLLSIAQGGIKKSAYLLVQVCNISHFCSPVFMRLVTED
jgi:hypothetical protein